MNRPLRALALPLCAALLACSPGAGGNASLQSVSPSVLYRGRATALSVSGAGTAFRDGAAVSLSGAGTATRSVQALSATGLRFTVAVTSDAALGPRDVRVDSLTATRGVTIADALTLDGAAALVLPGASAQLRLTNLDASHPLDAGGLRVSAGPGTQVSVLDRTSASLTLSVQVAPDAAMGPRTLHVEQYALSDDADAGAPDAGSAPVADALADLPNALTVGTRDYPTLPYDQRTTLSLPSGQEEAYARLAMSAGQALSVVTEWDARQGDFYLAAVDPSRGLRELSSGSQGPELLAFYEGTADALAYLSMPGSAVNANRTFALTARRWTVQRATETEPNNTGATAQALAAPALLEGSLQDARDVDQFTVMADASLLVLRTLPVPGQRAADTVLTVFSPAGDQLAQSDDEDPASNSPFSFVRVPASAGRHLVLVTAGSSGALGSYRLLVVQHAP